MVTAAIGALQATIYYQQKKIMQGAGAQTQELIDAANIQACAAQKIAEASDRNAKAADKSATAAADSAIAAGKFATSADGINVQTANAVEQFKRLAKDTETNFRNEQRAWVGIHPDDIDYSTKPPTITAVITNTGRTPAFSVTQIANRTRIMMLVRGPIPFQMPEAQESPNRGTLMVDGGLKILVKSDWIGPSSKVVSIVGSPKEVIIVSGKLTYDVAYGGNHFTDYCFYYISSTSALYAPASGAAQFCPYGNDTDENPQALPKIGTMIDYP